MIPVVSPKLGENQNFIKIHEIVLPFDSREDNINDALKYIGAFRKPSGMLVSWYNP